MAKQEWAIAVSLQIDKWFVKIALMTALGTLGCNVSTDQEVFPPSPQELVAFEVVSAELPLPDPTAPQPINSNIAIRFSDFPDPTTINFPALQFGPRGQNIQYTVEVSLVAKQIRLRPRVHLLPQTDYFVLLSPSIRSLLGRPLGSKDFAAQSSGSPFLLSFHTGSQLQPEAPPPPPVQLADLLLPNGPLRQSCAASGCHQSNPQTGPARGLDFSAAPDLVRQALLSRRAGSESLRLVAPGQPEMSYLLRKVLSASAGGFLRIDGDPMPPPSLPPLSPDALFAIETWIQGGAK